MAKLKPSPLSYSLVERKVGRYKGVIRSRENTDNTMVTRKKAKRTSNDLQNTMKKERLIEKHKPHRKG